MTRHTISIRAVAFLATAVLLGGIATSIASAKTVKTTKTVRTSKMKAPDFAYPKTVEKNASAALDKALAHGDWPEAVDAVVQIVTADNIVRRNNALSGISRIDSITSVAPETWKPAFQLINADIYTSIYSSIRWQADSRKLPLDSIPEDAYEWSREIFADKVFVICRNILDASLNDSRLLKDWGKFINNTTDAFALGMTVEEFLCDRCSSLLGTFADETKDVIPFFSSNVEPITPTQKCASLRDEAIDRLIKSASAGRQNLLLAQALLNKANSLPYSLRMKYLLDSLVKVKGTDGEQLILSNLRDYVNDNPDPGMESPFPYSKKEYVELMRNSVSEFPKGRYVNSLKNIINDLTRPFSVIFYKGQYLTSSDITMDVKLSNCNVSWVLVYDYSPYANITNNPPKNKEIASRCRLVKALRLTASGEIPFTSDTKVNIGKLPKGIYAIIPSSTADGKGIYSSILNDSWREPFTVSDISVMTLQCPDAKTRVFVVDGNNGHPIEGAQVKVYTRKNYSAPRLLAGTLTTDKKGSVDISEERFDIEAFYEGSKWSSESRYFNTTAHRDTTVRNRVQILADRALCHPGDSIRASVIAFSSQNTDLRLNEEMNMELTLKDANGKEVATKAVVTDRFGRASIGFEVPSQGLLGNWQLVAFDSDKKWLGSTAIQVADYVAPTFFITSEHSDEDVNAGDTVSLKGQVLTYSGMPVGGATVRYSVTYTPPMRWSASGFATFNSSVTADAEGKYTIELPTANLKGTQFERGCFSVQLSATSPAGESQNGPTERFAIGKEFRIFSVDDGKKIEISDSISALTFYVNDMLGKKVRKELTYEMMDNSTKETVASGSFMSPVLNLPDKNYPSAVYTLKAAMKETPEVSAEIIITLWRNSDCCAPEGTKLWIPEETAVVGKTASSVNVTVGSGIADRWIPAVLSADGEILSVEWLHVDKENITIPVKAPQGNRKYKLNLSWLSNLDTETRNITVMSASAEERLKVSTESFRDKVSAGDTERWSFLFYRKSSKTSEIPALAVMTDAALNAITPFNWSFDPQPNRYGTYYGMREAINTMRSIYNILRKPTYLSYSTLSFPMINDYGQDWGLNGGMYYDGGEMFYSGGIKNEMKVMRSVNSMKLAASAMNTIATAESDIVVMEEAVVEADDAVLSEGMVAGFGNAEAPNSDDSPELRETECPVAFFMPDLISDKEGKVNIDFTVPNFNTTWAFQLIGYDNELQTAKTTLEAVASKPIMVTTHSPRFVRAGDVIQLAATVFNNSETKCSPKCRIELIDLVSGKTIAERDFAPEAIGIAANHVLTMNWQVPSDVSAVGFRAYAEAAGHRDGEQALLPVLPASTPIVESTPFWIAPGIGELEVKLPKFKNTDQVTLQYCNNPAWYCISALPDIVKPESKSVTAKIKALFGNAIAYNLISNRPNLRKGLEILLSDKDSQFAALKSNLEKDGNIKITQLSNTPWVNNAESETLRMSRLVSLLDETSAHKTICDILEDIRSMQTTEGGWSWCPEMEASPYITRDVVSHFAMMMKDGAIQRIGDAESMIKNAIRYVDAETVKDYHKSHKNGESLTYLLDWLYIRSSFPASYLSSGSTGREMSAIADKACKDIAAEWKDMGIGQKAKAAMTLWRTGNRKIASEILESLRQFASESPEKGMWFDNLNSGWGGMSVIRATTLVLEAYAEIQPENKIVDSLRQWLVLGRQYQDWGKNTYTVEIVNAILSAGTDWTGSTVDGTPLFFLKGKKIDVPETAKLTGAFTLNLDPRYASNKTLTISGSEASPSWGGVISQYESPIMEVKPASVPDLSIRKTLVALIEGKDGQIIPTEGIELKKGMKVRVTLFINSGRDMDYVAVTDERSACLEPIEQLSGYTHSDGVGFYREVRDSNTNLFFGWLPKGTHIVSYDCRVSQEGIFSCGIATVQSQYSPLTVAHSTGSMVLVK